MFCADGRALFFAPGRFLTRGASNKILLLGQSHIAPSQLPLPFNPPGLKLYTLFRTGIATHSYVPRGLCTSKIGAFSGRFLPFFGCLLSHLLWVVFTTILIAMVTSDAPFSPVVADRSHVPPTPVAGRRHDIGVFDSASTIAPSPKRRAVDHLPVCPLDE